MRYSAMNVLEMYMHDYEEAKMRMRLNLGSRLA